MNNLVVANNRILPMSSTAIDKINSLAEECLKRPQIDIDILHMIHGGMYARTVKIPEKSVITGALVKLPTILIIQGDVIVYIDDEPTELHGYNIFAGSANRKQAFFTLSEIYMTMIFAGKVNTVEEAENCLTDEASMLLSRKQNNSTVIITGE